MWTIRGLRTGASTFAQHIVSYDPAGQVRQDVENGPLNASHLYTYDNAGQLTNERLTAGTPYNLTYSYDPTGNRLAKLDGTARTTYVYDAANQLQTEALGAVITTYVYDQNGNRAAQVTGANITTYTWDEENRLTGITYPDATIATYLYSADGLRQRKIDSTGTVNYLRDEGRVLQETDASLIEIVRYSHGTEGWSTLVSQRRGGVDSFFGFDFVGNTRLLVDLAGNTTDTTVYESFGVERARTGTTLSNYQFGGQVGYIRDLLALHYAQNRIVDSKTGRWLSRDPIGFGGGTWNLLEYVGNDPVSGVDPSGLEEINCPGACPPSIAASIRTACEQIRRPWNRHEQEKINYCIKKTAAKRGQKCSRLSDRRLKCMRTFCGGFHNTICKNCDGHVIGGERFVQCAETPGATKLESNPETPLWHIFLCMNHGKGCHNGFDLTIPEDRATFLHELGHACGLAHGERSPGNPYSGKYACNEIWACCSSSVLAGHRGKSCWKH